MSKNVVPENSATDSISRRRTRFDDWIAYGMFCVAILVVCGVWLIPDFPSKYGARKRPPCNNRLHEIGVALLKYNHQYNCLPPSYIADEHGKPMHSWRVLLLPFLDEPALYNEYRFDEPWDGPHNSKLHDRIVAAYHCPLDNVVAAPRAGLVTSYVAVLGQENAWPTDRIVRLSDITDGTSNTLCIAEVANSGIHWMEPRDLHFQQMCPTINGKVGPGISSNHGGGANVLLLDGSVRFLNDSLPAETLRALMTIQ